MKFTLPMPPSINQTYGVSRTGDHAFYKRKTVKDWEFIAGWDIKRQWVGKKEPFVGPVAVSIVWYYRIDRDIDAGLKVLLDLLQKQNVVENDRQIRKVTMDILPDLSNARVEIEINEL